MKKIAIITMRAGRGHLSAASALHEAFRQHDTVTDVIDVGTLISEALPEYTSSIRILNNAISKNFDIDFGGFAESAVEEARGLSITGHGLESYDEIVSVAPIYNGVIVRALKGKKPRFWVYPVDLGEVVPGYWIDEHTTNLLGFGDYHHVDGWYAVPGLPLRRQFFRAGQIIPYGRDVYGRGVLVTCGGFGHELTLSIARALRGISSPVTFMCGDNYDLAISLDYLFLPYKWQAVYGRLDAVDYDQHDIVIGTGGAITAFEAAARGKHLICIPSRTLGDVQRFTEQCLKSTGNGTVTKLEDLADTVHDKWHQPVPGIIHDGAKAAAAIVMGA